MSVSQRHSRGWADIRRQLEGDASLRVLDFGATSPVNINYLTSLGQSVYMANVVADALKPEWQTENESGEKKLDVERFFAANLDFSGRDFDVVLLWDTLNYVPAEMAAPLVDKLHGVMNPNGRLLAFFHGRTDGPETLYSRYQLTTEDDLTLLVSGEFPVRQLYQTRQIERLLEKFSDVRFYLGKDNVREVIATK